MSSPFHIRPLGLMPYRQAWALQEQVHAEVAAGTAPPTLLLVEHPPVITLGRRAELSASHLRAAADTLAAMGVDVVPSDRGGDITFHGPGQLVAYPILRLADFHLSVGAYVHLLEAATIDALATFGITARADPTAIGVWTDFGKLAAVGVRVKCGTTLHGLALNVTTDLSCFNLIVPCGLDGRPVTSLGRLLGASCPTMEAVADALGRSLGGLLAARVTGEGRPTTGAGGRPPTS